MSKHSKDPITGLSQQEELFCYYLISGIDEKTAYAKAGFAEKSAYANAYRKKEQVHIKAYLDKLKEERTVRLKYNADDAFNDILTVKNRDMQAVPVMEYDKELKTYKQKQDFVTDPETGETKLMGMWTYNGANALKAVEMAIKYYLPVPKDGESKNLNVNLTNGLTPENRKKIAEEMGLE